MMVARNPIRDVSWYGTTHCRETGLPKLSFVESDGSISYFRFDLESAHKMVGSLVNHWLCAQGRDVNRPPIIEGAFDYRSAVELVRMREMRAKADLAALQLSERLGVPYPAETFSQRERSSGNPNSEVSTPEEGVNVCPPTTSSSAAVSE